MSQTFGHFLIGHAAVSLVNSDLAHAYVGHINFGTQGPDLFYITGQSEFADQIHGDGTLAFYSNLLEKTLDYDPDSREHQAIRAYAHGFYSHVIADCVFHPFVNRLGDNNWAKTSDTKVGTTNHKAIETLIDDCLLGIAEANKDDFLSQLKCYDGQDDDNLDPVINLSMNSAFNDAYPNIFNFFNEHTLGNAYKIYLATNYIEKAAANLLDINFNSILARSENSSHVVAPGHWKEEHKRAMNIARTQWYAAPGNELLLYTGEELYNMAIRAASDVIKIGEDYVQRRKPGSLNYLKNSGHVLLQENYNLDTGLPSIFNDNSENRNPNSQIRFGFMAKQLSENYQQFG